MYVEVNIDLHERHCLQSGRKKTLKQCDVIYGQSHCVHGLSFPELLSIQTFQHFIVGRASQLLDRKLHPRHLRSGCQACLRHVAPVLCQDLHCSEPQRAFARCNIMDTPNGAGQRGVDVRSQGVYDADDQPDPDVDGQSESSHSTWTPSG
jgi:hypothetical protein